MELQKAKSIADNAIKLLRPHCERIQIAGSIRRQVPDVGDIEIVCIPKPFDTGLFSSGIATVVNQWKKVKGELPCKYTQRKLPEGVKLDLFFATPENWGLILAIRTGSAYYSHHILAKGWVKQGYHSDNGNLTMYGKVIPVREEKDLFRLAKVPYLSPKDRNINHITK